MSTRFADASIQRKLMVVIAFTTVCALIMAALALGVNEVVTFRRTLAQNLAIVADIVGRNSTAALAFKDASVARDVLAALGAEPGIEAGAVFDGSGKLFATYLRDEQAAASVPPTPGPPGARFDDRHLVVVNPIVLDGESVGTVYLRSGLDELTSRMLVFTSVVGSIVGGSTLVALLIAAVLQRWISKPILGLARTAQRVTSERNFSLRATRTGHDEVGSLVDDFNRMLAEIERQNQELRDHRERLEADVANRTRELVTANERLTLSVQRVQNHVGQIEQLTDFGQLLQSCNIDQEVFDAARHAMGKLFPADSGAVVVLNSSGTVMEGAAVWGDAPPRQRVFEPDDCWAFRRGHPHVVSSLDAPLRCAHLTPEDGPVSICIPMIAQGDNLGILQFNFRAAQDLDAEHQADDLQSTRGRLAVALSEHIALALANLRLKEALRNQSIRDPLTGLFNRRYLEQVLERECRRAVRSRRPLTLLALDVDHFKQFNDTWGHDGGDAVLRELGTLLKANFRGEDVPCRLGGEEFVVLMADAALDTARDRAEHLRRIVQQLPVKFRSQTLSSITISVGLAAFPEHGASPEGLLETADRALYQAKKNGRNRVVSAAVPADVTKTAT
jgi:diguanylate cyclase (GGDEF)-like protein